MGVIAMVVVAAIGGFGCFSTARYDDAHLQRVARINARYEAERRREDEQYATLASALDKFRMQLVPTKPGSSVPVSRINERRDIVECRTRCVRAEAEPPASSDEAAQARCLHEVCRPAYVDALTKTYFDADVAWVTDQLSASDDADVDLEALLAFSHNQEVLRYIAAQAKVIEQLRARAHDRLDADHQGEVHASDQQRTSEIASGRAIRRARLRAAAYAFTAMDRGPISARQPCVGATVDQLLSRVGECRAGGRLSGRGGRGASSHSSQPAAGGATPARR
jgi:hypothetical protein